MHAHKPNALCGRYGLGMGWLCGCIILFAEPIGKFETYIMSASAFAVDFQLDKLARFVSSYYPHTQR